MSNTTKTAVVKLIDRGSAGDIIVIADARGQVRRFQLDTEEHRRQDETCAAVQIGDSTTKTAHNLYRKLQPLLAIMGTVENGVLRMQQDYPGDVKDIEVTGPTFEIVSQWS